MRYLNTGLSDPRPWLPAGYLTPALLIVFSVFMMTMSIPGDRAYRRATDERIRRAEEAAPPRPARVPPESDSVDSTMPGFVRE